MSLSTKGVHPSDDLDSLRVMNFSAIYISLALCITDANGFTASTSKAFVSGNKGRATALNANIKSGPEEGATALESLIHPGGCPCYVTPRIGVSPRAARIEIPLRALFASAAFAGPALAEEASNPPEASDEAPETEALKFAEEPEVAETEAREPAEEPGVEETEALKPADEPQVEETEALKSAQKPEIEEPAAEEPKTEEPKPPAEPKPAPSPKSFEEALEKYFPKALPSSVVATKVQATLSKRKFTRANTLFGTSICPDEINNKPTKSLPAALQRAMTDLNGVFHLGGLAGLPYMGTSGMKAFLSHCPMNGKVFIMYGPHIGITDEGIVGKVERLGQTIPSLDCDTTLKALEVALSPPEKKSKTSALDKLSLIHI